MDSLTDLEEFQISTTAYADINPKKADSDDDGLEDGSEIDGAGMRRPTDPTEVTVTTTAWTTGSNPIPES